MTAKEMLLDVKRRNEALKREEHFHIGEIAMEVIEKLVDYDTPKKVCYDNLGRSECPKCDKSYLHNGSMNRNIYCGYCGQRLDWSELKCTIRLIQS